MSVVCDRLPSQSNGKSLLEIQEEQSRQETVVKTEQKQAQESQTKVLSGTPCSHAQHNHVIIVLKIT